MRGLNGILLSQARANRFSFYNRPTIVPGVYVEADGYVLNSTYGTEIQVQLPRGDYRFFLIGGGGGEGSKYTKGTIAVPKVTSAKYSCAGGGSGGMACFDVHIPTTFVTARCYVGAGGTYAYNVVTKAGNGGNTVVSIPTIGLSVTCRGGGGGKAKDGGTGTGGSGGVNDSVIPTKYSDLLYSRNGTAGKAIYLTAWNNDSKWPIGAGGGYKYGGTNAETPNGAIVEFPAEYEWNIISKCHVARAAKAENDFFFGNVAESNGVFSYKNCGYDPWNSNPWCVHYYTNNDPTTWQSSYSNGPGGGAMMRGEGGTASFGLRLNENGVATNVLLYDGSKGGAPGVIVIERKGRAG